LNINFFQTFRLMKKMIPNTIIALILSLFLSCAGDKTETQTNNTVSNSALPLDTTLNFPGIFDTTKVNNINLKEDVSKYSLQEIRILRNALLARNGYLFMEAELRGYYSSFLAKYADDIWARWESGADNTSIKLTAEEQSFFDLLKKREDQLLTQNFVTINGSKVANIRNVVNAFQYTGLSKELATMLGNQNFALVPESIEQLFQIYEENDYHQVPNFVSTDAYLQLVHMYFSYVLKSIEGKSFIPILTEYFDGMHKEATALAASTTDANLKKSAEYNQTFFAIAYELLTGTKKSIAAIHQKDYVQIMKNAIDATDAESEFLGQTEAQYPFSLYKPRGNYSRTEATQRYFRAMMWLQNAPMCREKSEFLNHAIVGASLMLNGISQKGNSLLDLYNSVFEPIVFLIGEPDNLSVMDICQTLKANNVKDLQKTLDNSVIEKVNNKLVELSKVRNRIKPKIPVTCTDKINFMPQRYLADNEIMLEMSSPEVNSERGYPKGVDVFACFGNAFATSLLTNFYKDQDKWKDFSTTLDKNTKKFKDFKNWDATVYDKWIQSLVVMQDLDPAHPVFMQHPQWQKKNMNTALASWAQLKHDAILYGEQPMMAECGGGGPPEPITKGYVEPNVKLWKNLVELLDLTAKVLEKNSLYSEDLKGKTTSIKEQVVGMLSISKKELENKKLDDAEYSQIEFIGSTLEYLTLSIVDPDISFQYWSDVKGPDRSIAVVADVYTRSVDGCSKNGILHVATGSANSIYVIVEIEGLLYLCRGASFQYYEFIKPLGTRLTDEEWQKMLQENKAPAIPEWMKDIVLPDKKPKTNEKVFYSSGC